MKKLTSFLFVLLIGAYSLYAEIVETKHFSEINSYVTPDTLVVSDIDDTIIVPHQMIGSDEWFSHRLKKHSAEGLHPATALEKTVGEAQAVRELTQMRLVESRTDKIIQSLQKKGVCVMGLTVQSSAVAKRTRQHLKSNKIDLTVNSLSKEDQYFPLNGQTMLYSNNILFTTGTSKGEALFTLLDKLKVSPKRIVFIDDKKSNIESVEKWAKERNVEFTGLRYGYSDQHKASFRPEVAEVQFNHSTLTHLLSDEEALSILSKKVS